MIECFEIVDENPVLHYCLLDESAMDTVSTLCTRPSIADTKIHESLVILFSCFRAKGISGMKSLLQFCSQHIRASQLSFLYLSPGFSTMSDWLGNLMGILVWGCSRHVSHIVLSVEWLECTGLPHTVLPACTAL